MPALIEVIGPDGLRELEELISRRVHDTGVTKEEWRQVLTRLDILEHDMVEIKAALKRLEGRIDRLEDRMDRLEGKIDRLEDRFEGLRKEFDVKFRWIIGLLFGSWITIILTILFKT